jgi:hypothetical protein
MRFKDDVTTGSTITSIRLTFSNGFISKVCDGAISALSSMQIELDLIGEVLEFEFGSGFLLSRDGFSKREVVFDKLEEMSSHEEKVVGK